MNLIMENPFKREYFKNVPEKATEEIYRNRRLKLPFDPKDLVMFLDRSATGTPDELARQLRVLPYHHRSADLGISTPMHEIIPATDNHAKIHQVYVQVDIKGGGFLFPEEHESKKHGLEKGGLAGSPEVVFVPKSYETEFGYDFLGLMDEGMAVTTIKRSRQLAEAGMRTEAVAGVYRIKKFRLHGHEVAFNEIKTIALEELRDSAKEAQSQGNKEVYEEYRNKIRHLKDAGQGFRPIIEIRLMRSILRLRDLKDASEAEQAKMLDEACECLNIEAQALGRDDRFEAKTTEGKRKWLEFITESIGKDVGILHGQGLVHLFLHMGNLTLAGEVVDLDSVQSVVHQGDGSGKSYENQPFFTRTKKGYACVSSAVGGHQRPDSRFGLPRCIIKDFRDACFSLHVILKGVPGLVSSKIRKELAREMVKGYSEGLGGAEPFAILGVSNEKLKEVLSVIADEVIGEGKHYPPIPSDDPLPVD